jgi:heparanase
VKVIMHNTLASSDYGLLDENTFAPRPNYWAALLWRRLMSATVLDPHTSPIRNVYVYAHCLQNHPGGVTVLVINTDRQQVHEITLPSDATLHADCQATSRHISPAQWEDSSTEQRWRHAKISGSVNARRSHQFRTDSITFLEITNADDSNCH